MPRHLSPALTAAAIVGLVLVGPTAASATATTHDRWGPPRPRPTAPPSTTPTATPTVTPTPTASPSSPAPTAAACAFPTSSFNGATYCPATIVGVRDSSYGTGTRVVLKGVTVTGARPAP